jgi:glucose/arabinose dehydrogenase
VRRRLAVIAATVLAVAGCGGGGSKSEQAGTAGGAAASTTTEPGPAPSSSSAVPAAAPDLSTSLRLDQVAFVSQPLAMAVRPGDDAIYVAEKGGRVRRVPAGQTTKPGTVDPAPVLDISGQVTKGSEQGLLGLTFSPDGSKLYVDYTDNDGNTQVVEYGFADGKADAASRRVVLSVDQPYPNHNGGEVAFGPDGKLYVGLGDGGSEYDPDNRGQDLTTLLAKILRIDPTPSGGQGYTVPSDNPFAGKGAARPETWVWGVRNPWRFSWDRQTNDVWIGDVGQDKWEEVDFLPAAQAAGANLGWSLMDSRHQFHGPNPPGGVLPIFEYTHSGGNCTVVGGYVYRGSRIPGLAGAYLYGDACSGKVWGLVQQGGQVAEQRELKIAGLAEAVAGGGFAISSFGEDAAGELYLMSLDGGVYRLAPA